MKKLILFIPFFISLTITAQKISELPAATTIGTSDVFPIVQGVTTKKVGWSVLKTNIASQIHDTANILRTTINKKQDTIHNKVIYVPIGGNIQTYINNAISGSTLILASDTILITSTITCNKPINIKGQGSSGFATLPVTPSHGTLIKSITPGVLAFNITSNNVRISNLSINLSGASSTAVNVDGNLQGIVLADIDVIVNCSGLAQGFTINNADIIMNNLSFYVTSTNNGCSGVWYSNSSTATKSYIADCYNVRGIVKGTGGAFGYCFVCDNENSTDTVTLNLNYSICRSLSGTSNDIAVASISTTTYKAVVNTNLGQFDGADYDVYQTGTNKMNLGGSVIFNDKIFGTVTYRAAIVTNQVRADTAKLTGNVFAKNYYTGQTIKKDSLIPNIKVMMDSITSHSGSNIYANNGLYKDVDTIKLDSAITFNQHFSIKNPYGITDTSYITIMEGTGTELATGRGIVPKTKDRDGNYLGTYFDEKVDTFTDLSNAQIDFSTYLGNDTSISLLNLFTFFSYIERGIPNDTGTYFELSSIKSNYFNKNYTGSRRSDVYISSDSLVFSNQFINLPHRRKTQQKTIILNNTDAYLLKDSLSTKHDSTTLLNKHEIQNLINKPTQLSGSLTDGMPTDAQITAIVGTTAAVKGAGFQATIKDTDGTGLLYKIESNGTSWFYVIMTQAL